MASEQGPFYRALGIQIRKARKAKRLTQEGLAEMIGLSRTSVTNVERGRQPIYAHTLALLSSALECPFGSLVPQSLLLMTDEAPQEMENLDPQEKRWVAKVIGQSQYVEEKDAAEDSVGPKKGKRSTPSSRSGHSSSTR
jgi:transcriptional regulator with XRE-family HTH domain